MPDASPATTARPSSEGPGVLKDSENVATSLERGGWRDFGFLPIPKHLRYDPARPFQFTMLLNITFGFGSTFTVMNLYYCQPLLIEFAKSFGVTYQDVSRIPTLIQAGYATGLLLISPLGDLVRRRPLLLLLVFTSASLSIGLAITNSLVAFETLCFLVGAVTVTPQVLLPLAADLAPPNRRASAMSIVLSGLLFGVLLARVIAGIIAEFASWRVVYYLSIGLQYCILVVLYVMIPDWPAKNKGKGVTYFGIMGSMAKYAVTEPVLIQASLINFASSACFSSFWVTLTFLLGGPLYNYSTLDIGLFGLVGMFGVALGPFVGRLIDRLIPWYATLIATTLLLLFGTIQTAAAGINIAAVIISCFGLDIGRQMQQVSLTTAVFEVSEAARARLNAVLIIAIFLGQVMGTAVGTTVFVRFGWRAAAGLSLGWTGWQLLILLIRGPHVQRFTWVGWQGGLEPRKTVVEVRRRQRLDEEQAAGIRGMGLVEGKGNKDGGEAPMEESHEVRRPPS